METLGESVLQTIAWPADAVDKELLMDKITYLRRRERALAAEQAQRQKGSDG